MTLLFSFTLSSPQSWGLLCDWGAIRGWKESSLVCKTGLGDTAGELLPVFPPLEQLANAATGEKEGCFLIPACTGLTCLWNRSGWGNASLCSCHGLGVSAGSPDPWPVGPQWTDKKFAGEPWAFLLDRAGPLKAFSGNGTPGLWGPTLSLKREALFYSKDCPLVHPNTQVKNICFVRWHFNF